MAFINRKKLTQNEIQNHNPLILSPADNGKNWVLIKEFSYEVDHIGSNNTITVPAGFVTDFASIPRIFWTFLPPWGKYGKAAIVHDYLYQTGIRTRKVSDLIFLEIMENSCVNFITSRIIYASVRLFGGFFYNKPCENNQVRNSDFVHQTFTSNSHYGGNLNYKGKSSKARFIIIGGFLGVLIFPFLFTQKWFGDFFNFGSGTGPIGDTIGGLTAPIIGFMSALLVYLAFREQVEANRIQMEAIKQQAKDNANAIELQKTAIEKQAQENSFTHDKIMSIDILSALKKYMTDPPDKFILNVPTYCINESRKRKIMIDRYKRSYEENKEKIIDVCLQLQFNFRVLYDGKYSSLFINNQTGSSGVNTISQLTRQIQQLSLEIESFLHLFSIIQIHFQQKNKEHEGTIFVLFKEAEKVYLLYYIWIWGMLNSKEFDLGMMADGKDLYDHLKERINLVHDEYLNAKNKQVYFYTYKVK